MLNKCFVLLLLTAAIPFACLCTAAAAEPRLMLKYAALNEETANDEKEGRAAAGPSPVVSTGRMAPGMESFDEMMTAFMREHEVPGAALAVTDGGRLVFAKGYGYADVAASEQATPRSLFRIASISKPITAVAILKLVEEKKLSLDDRVFEILTFRPHFEKKAKFDKRHRWITIRHLLQHRGGWDRDESFDPMFQSVRFARALGVKPPAKPFHVIRCMLGRPLDFAPGVRYAYSNYGYCLLGRLIEKRTRKTYEEYVQKEILEPIGVKSMQIGRTRLEERAEGEVRYYDPRQGDPRQGDPSQGDPRQGKSVFAQDLGQQVSRPYGAWYLEAMDSHGGWIASAVDLARFACAMDGTAQRQIVGKESLALIAERPKGLAGHDEEGKPKDVYYGLGWLVRDLGEGRRNYWHNGSLPGTATILIRRHDGRNFVALFNARGSGKVEHFGRAIDPLLHRAMRAVKDWPRVDLFGEF